MPLLSLALQIILIIGFQLAAMFVLWQYSFYQKNEPKGEDDHASHDNYAVFAMSVFQYITLVFVFSKGAPYRKPIYTNREFDCDVRIELTHSFNADWFLLSLVAMTISTTYLVVWPHSWFVKTLQVRSMLVNCDVSNELTLVQFELTNVSVEFRLILVALALINFMLAVIAEVSYECGAPSK